jgi:hypothetical protein
MAYRIPDSNINLSGSYQQGKGNIQISCVPDESLPLLGPNGERLWTVAWVIFCCVHRAVATAAVVRPSIFLYHIVLRCLCTDDANLIFNPLQDS